MIDCKVYRKEDGWYWEAKDGSAVSGPYDSLSEATGHAIDSGFTYISQPKSGIRWLN